MRAWTKQHFPTVDRLVDRFGYWGAFFVAIWVAMSGIANSISGLAQFGWGAVVFAGLAVACLAALSVTASLAMYRYFNPLPPPPPPPAKVIAGTSNVTAVVASNPQADRGFRQTMDFLVFQSTILMLDNLLRLAPNDMLAGPLQLGEGYLPKNAEALQFIEIIRDRMDPGTERCPLSGQ